MTSVSKARPEWSAKATLVEALVRKNLKDLSVSDGSDYGNPPPICGMCVIVRCIPPWFSERDANNRKRA